MVNYLLLPFIFLKFWYADALTEIIYFFVSLNNAFFQLFSLPLFLRTYFKPIKNEYRQGLIGFSIGMGMFVKTFLIIADLAIFILILLFEIVVVTCFFLFPIATVAILIYGI